MSKQQASFSNLPSFIKSRLFFTNRARRKKIRGWIRNILAPYLKKRNDVIKKIVRLWIWRDFFATWEWNISADAIYKAWIVREKLKVIQRIWALSRTNLSTLNVQCFSNFFLSRLPRSISIILSTQFNTINKSCKLNQKAINFMFASYLWNSMLWVLFSSFFPFNKFSHAIAFAIYQLKEQARALIGWWLCSTSADAFVPT